MMKYKVGDKIRIVPKELLKGTADLFTVEKELEKLSPKRVVTIRKIIDNRYFMEENMWGWPEEEIEGFAEEEIFDLINNRFEIMDL